MIDLDEVFPGMQMGVPVAHGEGRDANLYLWSRYGELISERQSGVNHEHLTGLSISELFGTDPHIEKGWELALSGETFAWVSRGDRILVVNGFLPVSSMEGIDPSIIVGFSMALSESAVDWMKNWGIPIGS